MLAPLQLVRIPYGLGSLPLPGLLQRGLGCCSGGGGVKSLVVTPAKPPNVHRLIVIVMVGVYVFCRPAFLAWAYHQCSISLGGADQIFGLLPPRVRYAAVAVVCCKTLSVIGVVRPVSFNYLFPISRVIGSRLFRVASLAPRVEPVFRSLFSIELTGWLFFLAFCACFHGGPVKFVTHLFLLLSPQQPDRNLPCSFR